MQILVGYQLKDSTGSVISEWGGNIGNAPGFPNPLVLPNGDHVCAPALDQDYAGYKLAEWFKEMPPKTVFDGADFLGRVTDDEYAAIIGSGNIQVKRWLDTFRLRGEIDVSGATAQAAKAGLVALGLITQERADIIFAVE